MPVAKYAHLDAEAVKRTRSSHNAMKARCLQPSNENYARYGGAGITVAARWMSFPAFLADMGLRPKGTSLDRFPDRAGNYEPGNCRWATPAQQAANRRPQKQARLIEHDGLSLTADAWARVTGISPGTIHDRVFTRGMPPAIALLPGKTAKRNTRALAALHAIATSDADASELRAMAKAALT